LSISSLFSSRLLSYITFITLFLLIIIIYMNLLFIKHLSSLVPDFILLADDDSKASTQFDKAYFEAKSAGASCEEWWVLSITITGPLGLVKGGIRNYFKNNLKAYLVRGGEIRWNSKGTKLRVLARNIEVGNRLNVLNTLRDLQEKGRMFTFEETTECTTDTEASAIGYIRVTGECGVVVDDRQVTPEKQVMLASHVCAHCNVLLPRLLFCSACKSSYYCGINCQKLDWPLHKTKCKRTTVK
jgi:hypothetical protein